MRREPELIEAGGVEFVAHALVVPTSNPEERKRYDAEVESVAVRAAAAYEKSFGAKVVDVSTPGAATAAGLAEHPGFDLLSRLPGGEERCIEVKGRAGTGTVELTENEWVRACNLGARYWLYVVFDCATPRPRLLRVQDPFRELVVKAKGGVVIDPKELMAAARPDGR
jgi:hypothetical protein